MIRYRIFVYFCLFMAFSSSIKALEKTALVLSEKSTGDDDLEVNVESEPNLVNEVFVPTKEWKTIKPGQAIPRGLHVRLNLATGEKEAKLNDDVKDEEDGDLKFWEKDGKKDMVNADGSKVFTRSQLKKALEKFEAELDSEDEPIPEADLSVKDKFRSYEELKKDLEKMRLQVKTDLEMMTELLTELKNPEGTKDRKLVVLEDLEYLVHQIDNAQNFVDMSGFSLVSQLLNNTDPQFREWASFIVGSASQSNPKVQIAAVESGILHHLIRTFPTEQSLSVRRKYLFAFSAILRNFPYAQKKFLELGGFEVFSDVLRSKSSDERSKFKIITLLSDLLHERREIEHQASAYTSQSPIQHKKDFLTKLKQYRETPLTRTMVESGWCLSVADLLSASDIDSQEKVLRAMDVMLPDCKSDFDRYSTRLLELETMYTSQVASDNSNEFLIDLFSLVKDVVSKLGDGRKTEKEEL